MSKKYLKCYYRIINRAFLENRIKLNGCYESHHIKPRAFGGTKTVLLTAREHYLAHMLLYKHFKRNGNTNQRLKMSYAWNQMTWQSPDNIKRYTSHTYKYARTEFSKNNRGESHPFFGKKHTEETRKMISESLKSNTEFNNWSKENMRYVQSNLTDEDRCKALESRHKYYDNRPKKFKIIMPNGEIHLVPGLDKFIKTNNLSRSMMRRFVDGGQVINSNNISTSHKVKNTVGIIIQTIQEGET